MRSTAAVIMVLLVDAAVARAQVPQVTELELKVGEQRLLSAQGVRSYSEGAAGVVDVRLTRDGARFILVGRLPGKTTLLLMLQNGNSHLHRIRVEGNDARAPRASAPQSVSPRDNIRLDFYFVQLVKDYRHQLGVQWPGSVGAGRLSASFDLLTGTFTDATAVVSDQALPSLDMAQARGWAKLLRQAAVITANGTEALFSGGGEVNVPVEGALTADIRQIAYGSKIRALPRYDRDSGRIELTITADVSDLSSDNGTGVPGRITSLLTSTVNLELGQSLVLAGLTSRSEARSNRGVPGLSSVPILSALFASHGARDEQSDSLIFIIPTVVDSVDVPARSRIRQALHAYSQFDGDLDHVRLHSSSGQSSP